MKVSFSDMNSIMRDIGSGMTGRKLVKCALFFVFEL